MSDLIRQRMQGGVFVIAEVGKNFIQTEQEQSVEDYLANAKRLVDEAVAAGADAVKFQTHYVDDEILDIYVDSPHFPNWKKGRRAWIERNTLATPVDEFWRPLKDYCEKIGIVFFSTPMSRGAAIILNHVGAPFWKVGSGDILDFVLLDYLRRSGKPIFLSSGMSTLAEVDASVAFVRKNCPDVVLMHCVSQYPCPPQNLRLRTIEYFWERYGVPIGFSDHSIVKELAVAAVALGAVAVEKHFTLSRDLWGPDHKASLTPVEFKEMVKEIREVAVSNNKKREVLASEIVKAGMGEAGKILQEGELIFRPLFRKSLVYSSYLEAGTHLGPEMLYAMRPQCAGGIPSERYEEVLGKRLSEDVKKYDLITLDRLI